MEMAQERSKIDQKYKWDLNSIYSSDEEWQKSFENINKSLEDFKEYEGRVCENGKTLLELLELLETVMREFGKVISYAKLSSDEDRRNQENQAMLTKARSLASAVGGATSFVEPEIQKIGIAELELLLESGKKISHYDHYLREIIRVKDHVRSAEIESLLAEMGEIFSTPNEIYGLLMNADMSFPKVKNKEGKMIEIGQVNFTKFMRDKNENFREDVYQKYYGELGKFRNTIAAMLKNSVTADVRISKAHNYQSSRNAAMDGGNIPTDVYDMLIDTIRNNLDVLYRHIELKRKSQQKNKLNMWDLYVPIAQGESPNVEYKQAIKYIVSSVEPLGQKYKMALENGIRSNWIDVYENKGKYSGAYSGGTYDTKPFILMNYQNDIQSMFTMAHELGHSMHSKLTNESQSYIYSGYEIFVAEVASIFNESLLTNYLLETIKDESFRLHVLDEAIERFRSTLFRQTMFADFEHQIHTVVENGGALVPDRLDKIYRGFKEEFYKPVKMDDYIQREWMRIPHFYYNYYVYQYATGLSAAIALSKGVLSKENGALEKYISFLKSGSSAHPLELLEKTGVDLRSKNPIENAVEVYGKYLSEMELIIN